eukprot:TRINITY_DN567_c0_g1_i4.p1 TRINITY_DN567_c0_g1~~TRINITY_DN567_c0_g1_i4.p1  ORF type:complete len:211 (-),score=48.70 TRINITY_DN567_c0_g1_i4:351-983(-)
MTSIEDDLAELETLCSEILGEMTKLKKMKPTREREDKITFIRNRIGRSKEVVRSVKVEIRFLSKLEAQPYNERLKKSEGEISQFLTDLEWVEKNEATREDMIQKAEDDKDYKKVLAQGASIQQDDLARLQNMQRQADQMQQMGSEILVEMKAQEDQIKNTTNQVLVVESNLKIASRQAVCIRDAHIEWTSFIIIPCSAFLLAILLPTRLS